MASLSLESHSAADAYWVLVNWYSYQSSSAVAVVTCLTAYISLSSHLHKEDVSYILGDVMPKGKGFPFCELTGAAKPSAENKDTGESEVKENDVGDDDVNHGDHDDDDLSNGEDDDEDDSDAHGSDSEDSDNDEDDDDSDDDEEEDDEEEDEDEESNQPPYKSRK